MSRRVPRTVLEEFAVTDQRWTDHVGSRIVVRVRGRSGLYDVLGDLLEADDEYLLVRTRRGEREVEVAAITAGHPVPPAPSRAAPPHRALSVSDLEMVMAQHWQADEQDWLGGWLLRASGGFTNRANSVLAIGEPGMPMDVAVLEVTDWYTDRGLRPTAASPAPHLAEREDDTDQILAAQGAFEAAGWRPIPGAGAEVLTGPTGELRGARRLLPDGLRIEAHDAPDERWLEQYHYKGRPVPRHGVRLLESAPDQVFVSVRDGDRVAGVVRGSMAQRWAGLTAMEVDPEYRRRGLGSALVAAVAQWAWKKGARSMYLQVGEGNESARNFYESAGFEFHHTYAYLTPQD
jgi:N-acetylglutamate synthase